MPLPDKLTPIQQLESGKASGAYYIHAEVYKKGGQALIEILHELFLLKWEQYYIL